MVMNYIKLCAVSLVLMLSACASPPPADSANSASLGYSAARHLLSRTGFAATHREVLAFAKLSPEQAVDKILKGTRSEAMTLPPQWVNENYAALTKPRDMPPEERRAFQQDQNEKTQQLRLWWLGEMLTTPSPLSEKMTLFWHNHFVSSQQKVRIAHYMYRQNNLLRQYALGNFSTLLHAVSKDPAMLIYLDSAANRKGQPNENFAREVMELFTLGEGKYSEQDIKEAARAFTGWSVEPETGQYIFRKNIHDAGVKTVLGKSGAFEGDAVLDILLAQAACAEFITRKLWLEFISPNPDETEVKRMAAIFRNAQYDIKPLLRAMLTSDAFYADANRGVLVKSPVELIVGTLRQFNISADSLQPLAATSAQLGQNLFAPPNVKGWPGGEAWINSASLLGRKQFLEKTFRVEQKSGAMMASNKNNSGIAHLDAGEWLAQFGAAADASRIQRAQSLALVLPMQTMIDPNSAPLQVVRQIVLDPAYQLK
jgi:uncharacterized protein (DUF1800 family)